MPVSSGPGRLGASLRNGASLLLLPIAAIAADASNPLTSPGAVLPELLRPAGEVFQLPPVPLPAPAAADPKDAARIRFERAEFRGNRVISTGELESVAAAYIGRDITAGELEELRQKLTRVYVDPGYVNSGALLVAGSAGGAVVFDIVEGRLLGVRVAGLERLSENYVVRRLTREGDGPLNLELLRERFSLLLGAPLFARLNGRLTPGERPGEAYFDVDAVRATPYQLRASVNNYRPPSIGAQTFSLNGALRNLSGFGDQLDVGLQQSVESSSGTRSNMAWRLPLGYHGTLLSLALDRGSSSVIEEPTNLLGISSKLRSDELGLSQTLFESLQHKLSIGVARIVRRKDTFLSGIPFSFNPGEPSGVTKERVWRVWQDYTYRSQTTVLALRSTFTSGKNNLQVVAGLPGANNPKPEFSSRLGQAQVVHQVLGDGAQLVGRHHPGGLWPLG